MAPSHEKGRRGTRVGDDEFVLYIKGVPAHCRWQELKDFVRQTAMHIRQAVVYDDPHGYPMGIGQIIIKNEDEAWRTFRKLAATGWDGQVLTVTLAKASAPTKAIAGPKQSPSANIPRVSLGGSVSSDSIATAGYLPPLVNYVHAYPANTPSWTAIPEAHPFSPSPAVFSFSQGEYSYYPMNPQPPGHLMYGAATMDPTMFIQAMPYYHQGEYSELTPSTAFSLTPSCNSNSSSNTVIVDNLHPNVDTHSLTTHFRRTAGATIEHCEFGPVPYSDGNSNAPSPRQNITDKTRYAMVTFPSTEEAARAVSLCNGSILAGHRIIVRLDQDCILAAATTPTPTGHASAIGTLHADEEWPSTTSLSSSSSPFFQPSWSSSSAFSGEGWNLFHSTATPSTSSSSDSSSLSFSSTASSASTSHQTRSSSPPSNNINTTTHHVSSSNRVRRDSGKEFQKTPDSCISSANQPLVVNGSMSGRAKM